jgi:PAS domain S-box-containing protein
MSPPFTDFRPPGPDAALASWGASASHLDMALEAAGAGTWFWDLSSEWLELDERERHLLGFRAEEPLRLEDFMNRVCEADRGPLQERLAAIGDPAFGDEWREFFRIDHPRHGIRWLNALGRIERDESGRARCIYGINVDVTETKQAELALRRSEAKYRRLRESLMDACASVGLDGRIVETNRAFEELLGYSHEELLGRTFEEITDAKWHAMERGKCEDPLFYERGYSDLYEKEYIRKDGRRVPVELRAFLLRDDEGRPAMIWGIVRDISTRKQAEETLRLWNQTLERSVAERTAELHQSQQRFQDLAAATFEGIAICDGDRLIDGNPQLAAMHGCEPRELPGMPCAGLLAPESRDCLSGPAAKTDGPFSVEAMAVRREGSTFPVEIRVTPGNWRGRKIRFLALRDLTEVKRAANRLRKQQAELESIQRQALLSEISAGIIHQIGQPLSAMGANLATLVRLLGENGAPPTAQQILEDLEADVSRLRSTVIHLRSLANPGTSVRQPTDLNAVVADILNVLRQDAENLGIRLHSAFGSDLRTVSADAVQLGQAVLNVVRNAMDACTERPPDERHVTVSTWAENNRAEIEILDSGYGISAEARGRLFDAFFTTRRNGIGMGLCLCRTILREHGGSIHAENRRDAPGAVFRMVLPYPPDP